MKYLRQKGQLLLKIDLPALLSVLLFAVLIFLYLIPGFEKAMMDKKRVLLHEMSSSAYSILGYYNKLCENGELSRENAMTQARSAIGSIRYGENNLDYFWITDMHPVMIVHPYRSELNGSDLTNYRDSKGKTIFVDFARAVREDGESFVEYMWQWNDDSTRIVPKLSYVRLFEPWQWVVGTGLYIEDVRQEIRKMELSALLISGIIGIVIIILLGVAARQGHKLEQKRSSAETELLKSRELYRTLAGASTEGVLIWTLSGLQANKTLLSWLDYSENEIIGLSIREILIADWSGEPDDPGIYYDELVAARFFDGKLRCKSGSMINVHTGLSKIQLGSLKGVLAVIKQVKPASEILTGPSSASIFDNVSTGLFRISPGRRNRFIYGNRALAEMLGLNSASELMTRAIDDFFIDKEQIGELRRILSAGSFVNSKIITLCTSAGDEFKAVINLVPVRTEINEEAFEGSVEYLAAVKNKPGFVLKDLTAYATTFIMGAPVSSVMQKPALCNEHATVSSAVTLMDEQDTETLVVTGLNGEPVGITDATAIGFFLAGAGSGNTEVLNLMNSSPAMLGIDAQVHEALTLLNKTGVHALIITSSRGEPSGIISAKELVNSLYATPELISAAINEASSGKELSEVFKRSRKLAVAMILGKAPPFTVTSFLSSVADLICGRAVELSLQGAGEAPCRFSFINAGSVARMESTFVTDQDNGIIYEDLPEDRSANATEYFKILGAKVNSLLAEAGYQLCKGNNMAGNPKWCQPVSVWKEYFSEWIRNPGPEELLEVSIFFDFRFSCGDPLPAQEVREHIRNNITASDIYFHHMAGAWKTFGTPKVKTANVQPELKKMIMPLTGLVRLYALKHNLSQYSTPERIAGLFEVENFNRSLLTELLKAWNDLNTLRLYQQALELEEDKVTVTYSWQQSDASYQLIVRKALRAINNLVLKASADFYTDMS